MGQGRAKVQGGNGKIRDGRGFSQKEVEAAGITNKDLAAQGLIYDARRRSCHDDNVAQLKALFADG